MQNEPGWERANSLTEKNMKTQAFQSNCGIDRTSESQQARRTFPTRVGGLRSVAVAAIGSLILVAASIVSAGTPAAQSIEPTSEWGTICGSGTPAAMIEPTSDWGRVFASQEAAPSVEPTSEWGATFASQQAAPGVEPTSEWGAIFASQAGERHLSAQMIDAARDSHQYARFARTF